MSGEGGRNMKARDCAFVAGVAFLAALFLEIVGVTHLRWVLAFTGAAFLAWAKVGG
jgi:hypothetical protein